MSIMRRFWRESPCMAAPETIYGMHENHSVKRSWQAGLRVLSKEVERVCVFDHLRDKFMN
ncbi:TPA: hypothetical protein MM008_003810 [Klebsiella variicola subsp. variicola]|nr:hypothetical protein [Klebsiella variicola subsp. variicola]